MLTVLHLNLHWWNVILNEEYGHMNISGIFFFFWFICMHEGNNSQEMYNLFPTTELKLDNNFFDFWCDAVAKK